MARPRTDVFWIDRIRIMLANNPVMSGAAIRRKLVSETKTGKEKPPTPVPSDRAIRRIMSEFKAAPGKERLPYRLFAWPESMELGALPWEASRAALDLLRLRNDERLGPPLIREALWFWHVTQAAPDAPLGTRKDLAAYLTTREIRNLPARNAHVERLIMYQPWKGDAEAKAFEKAPPPVEELEDKGHVFSIGVNQWTLPLLGRPVAKSKPERPVKPVPAKQRKTTRKETKKGET